MSRDLEVTVIELEQPSFERSVIDARDIRKRLSKRVLFGCVTHNRLRYEVVVRNESHPCRPIAIESVFWQRSPFRTECWRRGTQRYIDGRDVNCLGPGQSGCDPDDSS